MRFGDKIVSLTNPQAALLQRRKALLGPAYRLFYDEPIQIMRGQGAWLYDEQDRPFLDAYNNVAVAGHCHPGVVEAIARQAAQLNTHTRYLHPLILDYAERLLGYFPAALSQVTFTCTGSEANDLALRIARAATGGTGIIITRWSYHGTTEATAALSPSLGAGYRRPDHVRLVAPPDAYRGPGTDVGLEFGAAVRAALDDLRACGIRPAALLVDSIFSSDGVFNGPGNLLADAVAAIRAAGGVFIADEVQPGFGRTGTDWWGFQNHGIVPDMVTLGKPMGNGHPIGAVIARPEVIEPFGSTTRYFNTFAGNPVACAAGMAVLTAIETGGLLAHAQQMGAYLRDGVRRLAQTIPLIGDIRGRGLFLGVDLVLDRENRTPASVATARIVNGMRRRGVLIGTSGEAGNVLKIRPPLVLSQQDADILLARLQETLMAEQQGAA